METDAAAATVVNVEARRSGGSREYVYDEPGTRVNDLFRNHFPNVLIRLLAIA